MWWLFPSVLSTLLCLVLGVWAGQSSAGQTSCNVSLHTLHVYNDNIFFVDQDKPTAQEIEAGEDGAIAESEDRENPREKERSDWTTTLSPGIELGYEDDEFKALLKAEYNVVQYQKYTQLNDIDYTYSGELQYDATPYTSIAVGASFKRDSRPDRELETSGLIFGTFIRDKQDYSLTISHELTEYSMLNFTYNYRQDDFSSSDLDDQIAAIRQAELDELAVEAEEEKERLLQNRKAQDSRMHAASVTLSRDTGALITDSYMFTTTSYLHHASKQSIQDTLMMVAGIGFSYDEVFSIRIDGGARYSHEKYDDVQLKLLAAYPYYEQIDIERQQDVWGPIAHASVQYNSEWTTSSLDFSYDVQPASGKGTLTERSQLRLGHTRQLSEFITIHGFASYIFNSRDSVYQLDPIADEAALAVHNAIAPLRERLEKKVEPLYGLSEKSWNFGIEATWDFNRYCTLTGQYSYVTLKKENIYSEASRNRFLARLDIKYPFW